MADVGLARLGIEFPSPVVLASGPAGFGCELASAIAFQRLGALTTKTITLEPRCGNAQPRLVDCPAGALNSIGLENPGFDAFVERVYPKVADLPVRRFFSVAAASVADLCALLHRARALDGFDAIELNLSCPNLGGAIPGADAATVGEYVRSAVSEANLPLLVKLPGDSGNLVQSCDRALTEGASGVTLINSVRGLRVDWMSGRPFLDRMYGGLSGSAILPIALARVFEVRRAFPDVLIVGTGGVNSLGSLLEMLMAGADLVGIGFGLMVDPELPQRLVDELELWMDERGVKAVDELVGTAQRGGLDVH